MPGDPVTRRPTPRDLRERAWRLGFMSGALAGLLAGVIVCLASAHAAVTVGPAAVRSVYVGPAQVCSIYAGNAAVLSPTGAPVISGFGARPSGGQGLRRTLTLRASDLPATVTIGAASLSHTTSWTLRRVATGRTSIVASSPSPATSAHHDERLTATFHPPAAGWSWILAANNAALADCGHAHATATVRVVSPPTLTAFTATSPASSQGPGVWIQCAWLAWTATAGDPPAAWSLSQSGFDISTLPSARHLTPAAGAATGAARQRVCTTARPGRSTTLTLTGANEAGSVSLQATIPWAGGQ